MRLWTVHEPARRGIPSPELADRIAVVKDGFTWLGFLFTLPWLLLNRLWLATIVFLILAGGLVAAMQFLPVEQWAIVLAGLLLRLWVGLEGNNLRRRKLAWHGFRQVATVLGQSRLEAERAFFDGWTPDLAPAPQRPPAPVRRGGEPEVLGLFPEPDGGR